MEDFKLKGAFSKLPYFIQRGVGVEEFKVYSVSDRYISYLRESIPECIFQ